MILHKVYKRLLAILVFICMVASVSAQGIIINKYDGTRILIPSDSIDYVTVFENEDPRLDDVVPQDMREKMSDYMPFYGGINPPDIQGCFLVKPNTTVYCEGGHFKPGQVIDSYAHTFLNQDFISNTIDLVKNDIDGDDNSTGEGAFISGSENHFTIFFNTIGVSNGIQNKTALLISGIKTDEGIQDLYYGFVMVDKGPDPSGKLMNVGEFRVFKDGDGISVPYTNGAMRVKTFDNNVKGHTAVEGDFYAQ